MYPINLLIKPSSSNCNFKCKYCFYEDISKKREVSSYGFMSLNTLETLVKKALSFSSSHCNFMFQGGEPTLIGLNFYKKLVEYVKKYNTKNLKISYYIQTNGYFLNEEWAKFLYENNFLVGISLDGIKETNDTNRTTKEDIGTYDIVLNRINLLKKYNVEFNVLTVITSQVAKNINKIYNFYKENDIIYQQYIPCLNNIDDIKLKDYSLTPKLYGNFLCNLFDLWYKDITSNNFVYNRYFENIVGMLKGYPPEACDMSGSCNIQNVVEADGSVYPCDFYVLDKYKIGNIITDDFIQIYKNIESIKFIETSLKVEEACKKCKWINLCRGGCRRNRDISLNGNLSINYYCDAYKKFFDYTIDRFLKL
ncbi:anaerobic sulfatase maturase [uncultured Tyzzerella sp.]|uniref:anaerobic sulfatase maturase n=1 Tax=uncultured Tyzzerella sp. TaxID=2321398 RepID=UPI00294285C0|nr:anaerobic sulfatase maturase [uncultured Tyzzerella sp.]